MEETVSAADANRTFSRLLRSVREGRRYLVTSHGTPIARIIPATQEAGTAAARTALLERLSREPVIDVGRWTREELYEDSP